MATPADAGAGDGVPSGGDEPAASRAAAATRAAGSRAAASSAAANGEGGGQGSERACAHSHGTLWRQCARVQVAHAAHEDTSCRTQRKGRRNATAEEKAAARAAKRAASEADKKAAANDWTKMNPYRMKALMLSLTLSLSL